MRKSLIFLLIGGPFLLFSQDPKKNAEDYFNTQNWEDAARSYKVYLKDKTQDSLAWYRLAISTANQGNYDEALEYYDRALTANFHPSSVYFSRAKVFALKGEKEAMYSSLRKSNEHGFSSVTRLRQDKEFEPYREEQSFLQAVEAARLNAYPCLSDENYRHFDFWIGEWEVYVNGNKVGENSITLANGGCAIHERYTTAGEFSGQSINYYDQMDQKWHQVWVGSGGGVLDYTEIGRAPGTLRFQCDYRNPQGDVLKSRLTFTKNEDGTVRQLFENSVDGEEWTPGFDGLYKRKE